MKLLSLKKGTEAWYLEAYSEMEFDKKYVASIKRAANRVLSGKSRYENVAGAMGMKWYHIGAIHNMEASCDFSGCLHNGERIIGKGTKTKLVPKGKGPFKTWEESAIAALTDKGYRSFGERAWSIGFILQKSEEYNGLGYLKYHPSENSPYLWAQTSINDDYGKYVADGKWNPNADANGQTGIAAIIKQLELMKEITL